VVKERERKIRKRQIICKLINEGKGRVVGIAVVLQKILRVTMRRIELSACFFSYMRLIWLNQILMCH
jgi:hypothetical protein